MYIILRALLQSYNIFVKQCTFIYYLYLFNYKFHQDWFIFKLCWFVDYCKNGLGTFNIINYYPFVNLHYLLKYTGKMYANLYLGFNLAMIKINVYLKIYTYNYSWNCLVNLHKMQHIILVMRQCYATK